MKGIDLVAQEREEQINKHGFTLEDDSFHRNNELIKAALFCLNDEVFEFPFHWNVSYRNRILRKNRIGRLTTAAAYIVAQLDQELLKIGKYKQE
jgi:hypothetical protein